jgi:predicted transcriptional regulator
LFSKKAQGKRELNDGEEKILKAIMKSPHGLTFGEIKQTTGLSNPVISEYLKVLWKAEYIDKDVDERRYRIASKGKNEVKKLDGIERIVQSGKPVNSSNSTLMIVPGLSSLPMKSYPIPLSGERIIIDGYFSLDDEHSDRLDEVTKKIHSELQSITYIFSRIGDILSCQKECAHNRDFVTKLRESIDFDSALLLVYNGKEASQKINWNEMIQNADAGEKYDKARDKELSKILDESKLHRKLWLRRFLIHFLESSTPFMFSEVPSDSGVLKGRLIKKMEEHKGSLIPKNTSTAEIEETLRDLEKDGLLRIQPVTKYIFELDKARVDIEQSKFDELWKNQPQAKRHEDILKMIH